MSERAIIIAAAVIGAAAVICFGHAEYAWLFALLAFLAL